MMLCLIITFLGTSLCEIFRKERKNVSYDRKNPWHRLKQSHPYFHVKYVPELGRQLLLQKETQSSRRKNKTLLEQKQEKGKAFHVIKSNHGTTDASMGLKTQGTATRTCSTNADNK